MKIKVIKNKNLSDFLAWPVWECEPNTFDWKYDEEEHCFIIVGSVTVTTKDDIVEINSGDYVVFPKGLECIWQVHESIKKHYTFK